MLPLATYTGFAAIQLPIHKIHFTYIIICILLIGSLHAHVQIYKSKYGKFNFRISESVAVLLKCLNVQKSK